MTSRCPSHDADRYFDELDRTAAAQTMEDLADVALKLLPAYLEHEDPKMAAKHSFIAAAEFLLMKMDLETSQNSKGDPESPHFEKRFWVNYPDLLG